MHVVSRAPFDAATRQFPNQAQAQDDLYRVLKRNTTRHRTICKSDSPAGQDEIPGEMVGH